MGGILGLGCRGTGNLRGGALGTRSLGVSRLGLSLLPGIQRLSKFARVPRAAALESLVHGRGTSDRELPVAVSQSLAPARPGGWSGGRDQAEDRGALCNRGRRDVLDGSATEAIATRVRVCLRHLLLFDLAGVAGAQWAFDVPFHGLPAVCRWLPGAVTSPARQQGCDLGGGDSGSDDLARGSLRRHLHGFRVGLSCAGLVAAGADHLAPGGCRFDWGVGVWACRGEAPTGRLLHAREFKDDRSGGEPRLSWAGPGGEGGRKNTGRLSESPRGGPIR